ncbi:hypothetical protein [Hydrogenovibrio marinus]|uniref:Uncharacterized protein n=1 Tax=Hydrogenovibrio marinus TaxID=28885 RepID=A0A066ZWX7_HYDMR|nr:hypothetical protein [Hydrogenovibrio marinus]KDN94605.1 hypothetical protein EI16_11920 [Hydrogenovibrio marinus]
MIAETNALRALFPYCIKQQEDGSYVVLNRDYKPIGFNTRQQVNYEDYPVSFKIPGLSKVVARKLSWEGKDDKTIIYLYNDGTNPKISPENMEAYLERLERLSRLKLEPVPQAKEKQNV